jgi:PadR family transcriptional regulator PadR
MLRPLLLLLVAEEPAHGYGLMERLGDVGLRPKQGTGVYRELRDLEAGGLIESYWEASQAQGPARRMYRVTREGRRELDRLMVSVDTMAHALTEATARHGALEPWKPLARKRSVLATEPTMPSPRTRRGR